jgi:hypothetical protein
MLFNKVSHMNFSDSRILIVRVKLNVINIRSSSNSLFKNYSLASGKMTLYYD